jgi:Spy/CpxP family protein refolding chaperone
LKTSRELFNQPIGIEMKKTNLVLATVLASVLGLGSTVASAQSSDTENGWKNQSGQEHSHKRGGKRGGGKHMMKRMARQLSLTDNQKTQIKSFRETQKASNQTLSRDEKRQAFETFLAGILTAEQQTKMTEMKAKRAARKLERQQKRAERQTTS